MKFRFTVWHHFKGKNIQLWAEWILKKAAQLHGYLSSCAAASVPVQNDLPIYTNCAGFATRDLQGFPSPNSVLTNTCHGIEGKVGKEIMLTSTAGCLIQL